jgi:glutamate receptor, ionotropic kainate 2
MKSLIFFFIFFIQFEKAFTNVRLIRSLYRISIFYDEKYENMEDLVAYTIEANNHLNRKNSFQFEYTITRVKDSNAYKLTEQLCKEIYAGRIAILTIGNSKVYDLLKSISNSLNIPYLTIRPDTRIDPSSLFLLNENDNTNNNKIDSQNNEYQLNMHPPTSKIMDAIIDLIDYYKWKYITVLYRDPSRIEDLIEYAGSDDMDYQNSNHNLIFRYLSNNSSDWNDVMKEIRSSGTFHMIVDIETELISQFLYLADLNSLTSYYHHIMFTTLDLAVITNITNLRMGCNITALQMFEPNNLKINALFAGLNSKKKSIIFRYVPVGILQL